MTETAVIRMLEKIATNYETKVYKAAHRKAPKKKGIPEEKSSLCLLRAEWRKQPSVVQTLARSGGKRGRPSKTSDATLTTNDSLLNIGRDIYREDIISSHAKVFYDDRNGHRKIRHSEHFDDEDDADHVDGSECRSRVTK